MECEELRVIPLSGRMDLLPVVARWIFDEWWQDVEGSSVESLAERLRSHDVPDQVPVTLVAMRGQQPVGTATLLAHDVDTERWPDLTPWMAAVYVDPAQRRRGVGSRLVQEIVRSARVAGIDAVYLQTSEREEFYARRGWRALERTHEAVVMVHGEPAAG